MLPACTVDAEELPHWKEIERLERLAGDLREHIQRLRVARWQKELDAKKQLKHAA